MGTLKNIVDKADKSQEVAQEIREALNTLMELSEMHMSNYYEALLADLKEGKIGDPSQQLRVPITYVTKEYKEVRATTKDTATNLFSKILETVGDMVDDKSTDGILKGIGSIVQDALNTILGAGAGMETSTECYAVTVDFPAIVRYDFSFWGRVVEAQSIRDHCETAISCVAVKSTVDVTKLAFNDFLSLMAPVLNRGFGGDQAKILEMIQKSKEVYKMYTTDALVDVDSVDLSKLPTKPMIVTHLPVRATKGNF